MYKCGWWNWNLLFISKVETEGESLAEILERTYPVKCKLFDCDMKQIEKEIKQFNKQNKYVKYKTNGIYLERIL